RTLENHYLKVGVLLLHDVFESFRKVCENIYNLDPYQYYTAPGLCWDAMSKTTEINLELLTDIDIYNFIVRDVRGCILLVFWLYSVVDSKYIGNYDSNKESNYLIYLDVNNLFSYA
uniref:DNA-directed DNA polymerase n=1 Tax=Glossina morsitans morsitans TaxID=37546 RepID=A0A1B0FAL0_GLOMM